VKNTDLFDIFENAEDELMEDLTEMSPEISDERLEELFAVSERNYKMKKKEYERTRKDKNKEYDGAVSGVERVKRPVWLRPLAVAASFVLVAGVAAGTAALFRKGRSRNADDPPLADVYTDKAALAELCLNSPNYYNKLEASYVLVNINNKTESTETRTTTEAHFEYNSGEQYLLFDSEENYFSNYMSDGDVTSDSHWTHYYYKNKSVAVSHDAAHYEVMTYDNDWYRNRDYISDNEFYLDIFNASSFCKSLDPDKFSIKGKDTVCGRDCVVIESEDEYGRSTEYYDAETGVELKYVSEGKTSEEHTVDFEITDIKYNGDAHVTTPSEFRKWIEDSGFEPYVSIAVDENGNRVDPAVANNLDFLNAPEKPFTTAVQTAVAPAATTAADVSTAAVVTTTAEAAEETVTMAAPDENVQGELEKYAFELYKRSETVNDKINGVGVSGYGDGFLKVSVDPGLGYRSYDYEHNNSQWVDNVKFYLPAADENFTTADELRSYVRSAFTQNSFVYRWLEDNLIIAPDDFENGGYLDSEYIGHFLIYRGKLYMTAPGGGKGSLEPEYSEAYPVIITNKTDTSFTAYVAEWYGGSEPYNDLNEATCAEVKYVLDPEFNDWRINDIVTRPPGVYKELYDSRNN